VFGNLLIHTLTSVDSFRAKDELIDRGLLLVYMEPTVVLFLLGKQKEARTILAVITVSVDTVSCPLIMTERQKPSLAN
jgi:hypothetical protein